MNFVSALFCLGFVACLMLVTVRQWEGWPLSSYPMFSRPFKMEQIAILRIALETPSGQRVWWKPRFSIYSRKLDRLLAAECIGHEDLREALLQSPKCREYFDEIRRLVLLEVPNHNHYSYLVVVLRRYQKGPDGNPSWQDQDILSSDF